MWWRACAYQCNVLGWVILIHEAPTIPINLSNWSIKGSTSVVEMELTTRTLQGPYLFFLWRLFLDFFLLDFLCFFFFFSSSLLSFSLSLSPTQKYFQNVNNSSYINTSLQQLMYVQHPAIKQHSWWGPRWLYWSFISEKTEPFNS